MNQTKVDRSGKKQVALQRGILEVSECPFAIFPVFSAPIVGKIFRQRPEIP